MLALPLDIPGVSIRPPDRSGGRKCPKCKRHIRVVIIRRKGGKATRHCPFCGTKVGK